MEKHQRDNNKPQSNKDGWGWRTLTRITNNKIEKFTHAGSEKRIREDFALTTLTGIMEYKFRKHGCPQSRNTTTGEPHDSGTPREQHTETARIGMYQSQLLKTNQSQRGILLQSWHVTSRAHRSIQSKRGDLYHKWQHREINESTWLFEFVYQVFSGCPPCTVLFDCKHPIAFAVADKVGKILLTFCKASMQVRLVALEYRAFGKQEDLSWWHFAS